ncbi:peptidoglycan-binding protein [Ruminococcus sp.]|jgi:peptidoglycan hydrolase-like protein with peptidoglycan-binding domain|uniref:peptidoglycan-binding domain-containing protein n=1 Tax=Ruminococcus sp. TaxID=41978 RepID=UPI0025E6948A|nr:peptidoglycan-binding protein [Ruminococcus sp.]
MPYTDEQKKEHIRELQGYLYGISLFDKRIPQILPDGVYNSETAKAVEVFQRAYGLPVTGETDAATWNKIVSVYREYLDGEPEPYSAFPSRIYSAALGDSGELIYIIQAMLWKAAAWYDNMPKVSVSGEYDIATEKAVKSFQKCCGLAESGCVDCITWNMLVRFLTVR